MSVFFNEFRVILFFEGTRRQVLECVLQALDCKALGKRGALFKALSGALAPQTNNFHRIPQSLLSEMFHAVAPTQSLSSPQQPDIQQQIAALQALQVQQLQQQLQQQQLFPLGGSATQMPFTSSTPQQIVTAEPQFAGLPAAAGTSNVKVVIDRRNSFSLGFTPFKFSVADCKAGRIPFDFASLMEKIKFAESSGGLPVQAVEPNGVANRAGLRPWDVIIGVNNVDVRAFGGQQTIDIMKQLPAGTVLELAVLRSSNAPAPVVVQKIPSFADILCCGGGD